VALTPLPIPLNVNTAPASPPPSFHRASTHETFTPPPHPTPQPSPHSTSTPSRSHRGSSQRPTSCSAPGRPRLWCPRHPPPPSYTRGACKRCQPHVHGCRRPIGARSSSSRVAHHDSCAAPGAAPPRGTGRLPTSTTLHSRAVRGDEHWRAELMRGVAQGVRP